MRQAALALVGAGFTAAACSAAGLLLLRWCRLDAFVRRPERVPLGFLLGASALHLWLFAALAAQAAYWPVIIAPMLLAMFAAWRTGAWRPHGIELTGTPHGLRWGAAIAAVYGTLYFVYAWAPEHSPDGSAYHLGLIAQYLRTHGMQRNTATLYAMLGQGVELIFLPAFLIGRHSAAALVHFVFGCMLTWSIFCFGRRMGSAWAGAGAALLTLLSPVYGLDMSIAYIDAGTAAIVFAAFYWLQMWDREREVDPQAWRLLIPAGLMCGYAFAAKFTAFPMGLYALGFVLWRERRWKPVALAAAGGLLMAAPWVARNWLVYHNPMAPLGTAIFRNPFTHVIFEQEYSKFLSTYSVMDRSELPLEVTLRGRLTQGIVGPIFLLLPLGLLALRRRIGRQLWIAALLMVGTYVANVGTRFLIPTLPFFSLLIAMPLAELPVLLSAVVLAHSVLSWPSVIPRYADEQAWRMSEFPLRAALRIEPQEAYLSRVLWGYPAIRLMEGYVPEGEAVFVENGLPDSYTRRTIRVSFQSAANELVGDMFNIGWQVGSQPIRIQSLGFPAVRVRRIRLVQTAAAPYLEQWNLHELRLYSNGQELERKPSWRLQAFPNPWDVQLAFDNSPGTRWRSWETASPGMYVEVDLGEELEVDEVRIETSPDSPHVMLQPEVWNGPGWTKIPAKLESTDVPPNPNARRMATYEMHQLGIHYLLLGDGDFGAADVREDPETWGLKLVAEDSGMRLYKTTW
ncbi:MAG: hypothetical protein RL328_935 [Acidobacteriota bacterium]